jgi:hypothetical protein
MNQRPGRETPARPWFADLVSVVHRQSAQPITGEHPATIQRPVQLPQPSLWSFDHVLPGTLAAAQAGLRSPHGAQCWNPLDLAKVRADQRLDEHRSNPAMTTAHTERRSATVMPCDGARTSNVGPSTGPLTSTHITAAATRPTATNLRRRGDDSLEKGLVTGKC